MMVSEQVKRNGTALADGVDRNHHASSFQFYVLKTNRLEPMGLFKGDQLLIESSTDLVTGNIILIEIEGKLLLRKLEQTHHAWMLTPLQQQLAPLEWPLHIPLPLVGIVRQIIRQF